MGRLRSALETLGVALFLALLVGGIALYGWLQYGYMEERERYGRAWQSWWQPYPPPQSTSAPQWSPPSPLPPISTPEEVMEAAAIINANRTAAGLRPLAPVMHEFALARAKQVSYELSHCYLGVPTDVLAARHGFYWPYLECAAACYHCGYYMLANASRGWLDSPLHRKALHWECATHLALARYSGIFGEGAVALAVANYSLWEQVAWQNGTLYAAGVTRARPPYSVYAFTIEGCAPIYYRMIAEVRAGYNATELPGGLYRVELTARWEPPGPGNYLLRIYGSTENGWCPIGAYALAYKAGGAGTT
ncbi:MAG: hypothetical protein LM577_07550 [Thermoproteaceae archaeon]|nr:hypothetical protein [Thermoproteaceae archaeon]